jgi:hypothetical protein
MQAPDQLLACKDSYAIYSRYYSRHNQDFVVYGEQNHRLAVNFAHDVFYITGRINRLTRHLRTNFLSFQKIAIHKSITNNHTFLHNLPQLQELWVLLKD